MYYLLMYSYIIVLLFKYLFTSQGFKNTYIYLKRAAYECHNEKVANFAFNFLKNSTVISSETWNADRAGLHEQEWDEISVSPLKD